MINIPNNITPPVDKNSVTRLNKKKEQSLSRSTVLSINRKNGGNPGRQPSEQAMQRPAAERPAAQPTRQPSEQANRRPTAQPAARPTAQPAARPTAQPATRPTAQPAARPTVQPAQPAARPAAQPTAPMVPTMVIPPLMNPLQKGQKAPLNAGPGRMQVKMCFGWNVHDQRCDIDVSAFLVAENGKVISEDWLVFYGQDVSPDLSVRFGPDPTGKDREIIDVDFSRIHGGVKRIIFIMTINEALEQRLNFSMIKDAYVRILDVGTGKEILSYCMDQYYANVTSMTIGELYLHNGNWKFNAIGNGMRQDFAGQCAIYGVETC